MKSSKPLVYNKIKSVLGFPSEELLVFNPCLHKRFFVRDNMCETDLQSKGGACVGSKNTPSDGNCDDGPVRILRGALQVKARRKHVQRIDGPEKTGSDGVGDENLGVKAGGDKSVARKRAPQLDVQELELKQQPASQERNQEMQEAL